ncbi:MAG: hypothetical protein IJH07_07005 [Ruminococcus sp.]|nr:hypothetical protein [Ruminococcus sp.]
MSKSKKSAKKDNAQNTQNSTQNSENNMSYATDKQSEKTTDCHGSSAKDCGESNCR